MKNALSFIGGICLSFFFHFILEIDVSPIGLILLFVFFAILILLDKSRMRIANPYIGRRLFFAAQIDALIAILLSVLLLVIAYISKTVIVTSILLSLLSGFLMTKNVYFDSFGLKLLRLEIDRNTHRMKLLMNNYCFWGLTSLCIFLAKIRTELIVLCGIYMGANALHYLKFNVSILARILNIHYYERDDHK